MATTEALTLRRYGTVRGEPVLRRIELGKLSFAWQSGALRWLRYGDVEVIRGIAPVLRDPQWGTYGLIIDTDWIDHTARHADMMQAFHVIAEADRTEPVLSGELKIAATERRLSVGLTLTAHAPYSTARSGLSVLLPLVGVVGAPVRVMHTDGQWEDSYFPRWISPSQPLFAIRQLRFFPAANLELQLGFEGDVFEMEDQRNWSDASFKIYNRPLAWPTPYVLKPGEVIEQRVTIALEAAAGELP